MRETRLIMGMPVSIEIAGPHRAEDIEDAFAYFTAVDHRFSPYKEGSEVSQMNRGEVRPPEYSDEMGEVLALAAQTNRESGGYFDIRQPDGRIDPSGIVKGWAIRNVAALLRARGYEDYYVEAGGDIQTRGMTQKGEAWRIGIQNPFNTAQIVRVLRPRGAGVATSGTYVRGQHIYNPHNPRQTIDDIVSLTVLAPDVLEADRFATAAFAMGREGIYFLESLPSCEGYLIDAQGMAIETSGFRHFAAT